eukprot:TRINITY_DN5752_c0_g1_i1.p1 TRINITY_DN5752_c0_g1~~TRINITY_DN5752_c0_g1_i1.p1  ORF type:complete len:274 (-),score=69.25 TRINITY_DN5752_c0_g1_i1:130-951(-)
MCIRDRAVSHSRKKQAYTLLERGAQPNGQAYPDKQIPSPLIMAISLNDNELAEKLLEKGADINLRDLEGWSALHVAAENGNIQMINKLISLGADPDYTCKSQTSLDLAVQNKQWDAVAVLRPITKVATKNIVVTENNKVEISQEDKDEAIALKQKGNEFYSEGKLAEAIDLYTQAINKNPLEVSFWTNRAAAYLKLGESKKALADAHQAKKVDPDWIKAYFREGEAYMQLEEYGEAAASFWEGLYKQPSNKELKESFEHAMKVGKEKYQSATS